MMFARFLPGVFDDLAAAAKEYDEAAGRTLGDRLIQTFYSSVQRISSMPAAHREVYGKFRRVLLRPFPYHLYYRLNEPDVVFALLIHAARDPQAAHHILSDRK